MSRLREAQKRLTRELLLKEGLSLFEAKGYAATTIDDIAAGAGTTRTTFYMNFPSKAHLMQALITDVNELLTAPDDPPLTAVIAAGERSMIETWLRRKADQWPEIRPYVTAAHEAAAQDPDIKDAVAAWFDGAIADIEHGLDKADRFEPASRRIRGVLAFSQLEFLSRRWIQHGWDVDREQALGLLTDSWCSLLVD